MRAYQVQEGASLAQAWKAVELPLPEVGPGEVLIRIRAVSLNYRDLIVARGLYRGMTKPDCIPTSDGAGEIEAVAPDVTGLKVGDRVVAAYSQGWTEGPPREHHKMSTLGGPIDGMLSEYVVLNAKGVVPVPDTLSFEEAATLPCAAVTAWHALMAAPFPPTPGSSVLTLGSGGVSTFAILFGKAAGLRVIATTGSEEKMNRLYNLGADAVINYRELPDWPHQVRKLTQGEGVDQVVEVGGPATLSQSLEAVKLGGKISLIGVVAGLEHDFNPMQILQRNARVQGITVGPMSMLKEVLRFMEVHHVRPVIDRHFGFDQASKALERLQAGAHIGKIVIQL